MPNITNGKINNGLDENLNKNYKNNNKDTSKESQIKEPKDVFKKFIKRDPTAKDEFEYNQPYNNKARLELLKKVFNGDLEDQPDTLVKVKETIKYGLSLLSSYESIAYSERKVEYVDNKGDRQKFSIRNDFDNIRFQFLNCLSYIKLDDILLIGSIAESSEYINYRDLDDDNHGMKFALAVNVNTHVDCRFTLGQDDVYLKEHYNILITSLSTESTSPKFTNKKLGKEVSTMQIQQGNLK